MELHSQRLLSNYFNIRQSLSVFYALTIRKDLNNISYVVMNQNCLIEDSRISLMSSYREINESF